MAKTPYLDAVSLASVLANGGYSTTVAMTEASNLLLLSGLFVLRMRWIWESSIQPIDDSLWELITEFIEEAEAQLMTNFAVGNVFASVAILTSPNVLLLFGQLIPQADYPELAAVVPAAWLVGSDIQLPNMLDTSVHGATSLPNLGTIMGENDVTLDVSQIPSHNHTQNPHTHSEIIPVVTPSAGGTIPAIADLTVPTPAITGATVATNNPTGGDGSHNNVPQSLQVAWYIVVR